MRTIKQTGEYVPLTRLDEIKHMSDDVSTITTFFHKEIGKIMLVDQGVPEDLVQAMSLAYATNNEELIMDIFRKNSSQPESINDIQGIFCTLPTKEDDINIARKVTKSNCGYKIYRLQNGRYYITPIIRMIERVDPPVNTTWSSKKQRMVFKLYRQFLQGVRYNSISVVDNFMQFVRLMREYRPEFTLEDIHPLYTVSCRNIAEKYKGTGKYGGNCIDHSATFIDILAANGIKGYLLGYGIDNVQGRVLNAEGTEVPWFQAINTLGYTHGCVGILIKNEAGTTLIKLEMGDGTDHRPLKYRWVPEKNQFWYLKNGKVHLNANACFSELNSNCNPFETIPNSRISDINALGVRSHWRFSGLPYADPQNSRPRANISFDLLNDKLRLVSQELSDLRRFLTEDTTIENASTEVTSSSSTLSSEKSISTVKERPKDGRFELNIPFRAFITDPDALFNIVLPDKSILHTTAQHALYLLLVDIVDMYKKPLKSIDNLHYLLMNIEEFLEFLYKRP